MSEIFDAVVIGAGVAGISAGRRLARAGANFVLIEARDRIGGRAHTIVRHDLPCEWLHSTERNVVTAIQDLELYP